MPRNNGRCLPSSSHLQWESHCTNDECLGFLVSHGNHPMDGRMVTKKKHAPKTAQQTPPIEVLILLRSPYSSPREHILVVGCCWYNLHPCFQKGPKMIIQHSRFDHLFYKLAKLVCFLPGHCGSSSFAPVQMRLWQWHLLIISTLYPYKLYVYILVVIRNGFHNNARFRCSHGTQQGIGPEQNIIQTATR